MKSPRPSAFVAFFLFGCAHAVQPPVTTWHDPVETGLTGLQCRPAPDGAATVIEARLAPLRDTLLEAAPSSDRAAEVLRIEPAFEDFTTFEGALCDLLAQRQISLAQYDEALDSIAIRLPSVAAGDTMLAETLPGVPVQQSPEDGAVFSRYPRNTTLRWTPVAGARAYMVEIQPNVKHVVIAARQPPVTTREWYPGRGGLHAFVVTTPGLRFDFVGAQPGRWRVRALDEAGHAGYASPWRTFEYTR